MIVDQTLKLERTILLPIWYSILFFMDNNPILSGRLTSLHEHGITDNDILDINSTISIQNFKGGLWYRASNGFTFFSTFRTSGATYSEKHEKERQDGAKQHRTD